MDMVELVSSNWEVSDERRPNFADADSLDLLHKKITLMFILNLNSYQLKSPK
jgi:hypothetical protein